MERYYNLLTSWCDRLIDLQIREIKDPAFYGGILCPACVSIHGRMGDAVYPFIFLYDKTGEEKYLHAAKLVIEWSEHNVLRKNGGYFNDKSGKWMGISVFSAISLGDTLLYHGQCLDAETHSHWMKIFERLTAFVYDFLGQDTMETNVNYYAAECHAMALAYKLTGNEKYKDRAYQEAANVKAAFDEDGLLLGEGLARPKVQKRGSYIGQRTPGKHCGGVDIGYNVEESLPALTAFAHHMEDEEYLKFCADKYATHLEFMLPDGAWDNSFGSRADKWTYWGSRTSDGTQVGLCHLANYDPMFAEAAQRNFELYEKCSADGFLYGGLMYIEAGEEACTHHSFCHAKALCAMMDSGFVYHDICKEKASLPRDAAYGVKFFPSAHVHLISRDDFRATVSDSDVLLPGNGKGTTGGTVTMLWNKKIGPVFAAAMAEFQMAETRNMQYSRHDDVMPNTALRIAKDSYQSVNDGHAQVQVTEAEDQILVTALGTLRDIQLTDGNIAYRFEYRFQNNCFTVNATASEDCRLYLPVIASYEDEVLASENQITIQRKGAMVRLMFDPAHSRIQTEGEFTARNFHVIGGFLTLPLFVDLKAGQTSTVQLFIE